MKLIAADWANDQENIRVFDGKKISKSLPKASPDLVIVTENMPFKQAKPYLEVGAKILRTTTDQTTKYRELMGLEKTHDNDVKILYALYEDYPEEFREWKFDPIYQEFATLYAAFKEMQKMRVALNNRLYAGESELVKETLKDFEKQEAKILKTLESKLKTMPIYTDFLISIKGIGPATSAGLIAYVGDIKRFKNVSSLMKYFGLDVQNGKAPRMQKGQQAKWHHKGRSLILGVIADSFVKQRNSYRKIYDEEKAKQIPLCEKLIIAEKRARRKMAKEFIKDFYQAYYKGGVAQAVLIT